MSKRAARGYDGVVLAVPVTVPYARTGNRTTQHWLGRALRGLIDGAGIAKDDIDGLVAASYSLGADNAVSLVEHFGLTVRWLDDLPVGGAAGGVAVRRAARAVEAGDAEIIACIAGDTIFGGGFRALIEGFSEFSRNAVLPYGAAGPNGVFALITRAYMDRTGASRQDLGRICIAQRRNAASFPHALFRGPLGLDSYMAARPIAEPLHLFDCVLPCCGAEGFLVMTEDRARGLGLPFARIAAAAEWHNAWPDDPVQHRLAWQGAEDALYRAASAGPGDMGFVQAYDDYPVIVLLQLEALGFCAPGEGARFVRETALGTTGEGLPLNTNGGQLSVGQAGAGGGFLGLVEGIRQITGTALGEAVPAPRAGLVSGYGSVNYDRGLCASAVILAEGARAT